jgi:hypothetical protein
MTARPPSARRVWLTIQGYDLVKAAEDELLGATQGAA